MDLVRESELGKPAKDTGRGRPAAFFDLDKTLMAGSSGVFFARAAYETGMISRSRLLKDLYENLRFRLRGSTDDRADNVRKRVGEMIAGVPVRDLQRLSPRVLAGVLPRLYPQMLERAYAHQDAGVPVYILTAASQEMADLLAHVLSFDGGLGSRSEIVDGCYTGRPAGPFNYREGKVVSMQELAAREGIDLAASHAYSDSESDLPMLRAVGQPVVVNPDAELRRIALEEGWEVLRLDRLGQRLKIAAGLGAVAALGGLGRAVRGGRGSVRRPARIG
jgi:HAD superfamily hydrolase (TIGR01490 family)